MREPDSEKTLEDTVESALDQIIEKKYDAELLGLGITQERIRHYGFAFEGKKVFNRINGERRYNGLIRFTARIKPLYRLKQPEDLLWQWLSYCFLQWQDP
mgnify:CR=1 FL=1